MAQITFSFMNFLKHQSGSCVCVGGPESSQISIFICVSKISEEQSLC